MAGLDDVGPTVELQDRGDHYSMTAELPGFEKKDVEVRIGSGTLELRAERSTDVERESEGSRFIQRNRSYLQRYLTLPAGVVPERISGTMKNGVLELKLPKSGRMSMDRTRKVDLR
jgi:HSP20 family protein